MSFYYFTSADSGAPTLSGTNGTMVTVLDWILVTKGGWTKDYTGTNKAIFRAPSGNRFPLRVVHDSAVTGNAARALVRGCESASGIDTVTDPFPLVSQLADSAAHWSASDSASATARPYCGIVTDKFVWLFVQYAGNNIWTPHFYGDCSPQFAGDNYCTGIFVTNNPVNGFFNYPSNFPGGTSAFFWARSISGAVKSSRGGPFPIATSSSVFGAMGSTSGVKVYPNPFDSKLHMTDVSFACVASQTSTTPGSDSQFIRGWMPNLKNPLHQASTIASRDTFIDSAYNASATFELFSGSTSSGSTGAFIVMEKSDTWVAP